MRKLKNLIFMTIVALLSTGTASAFSTREYNEYQTFKTEYQSARKRLRVLSKTVKTYKNKHEIASSNNDSISQKRYIAKLNDAIQQRHMLREYLSDLRDEIESFDEFEDLKLVSLK